MSLQDNIINVHQNAYRHVLEQQLDALKEIKNSRDLRTIGLTVQDIGKKMVNSAQSLAGYEKDERRK